MGKMYNFSHIRRVKCAKLYNVYFDISNIFCIFVSGSSEPLELLKLFNNQNIMVMEKFDEIYNYLTENQLFTFEELNLLCYINGYSEDTLNSAIYARYGLRTYEALLEDLL
jgi:hypothetical protein